MKKDKNYLINTLEELSEEEFADQAIGDEHWDSDE